MVVIHAVELTKIFSIKDAGNVDDNTNIVKADQVVNQNISVNVGQEQKCGNGKNCNKAPQFHHSHIEKDDSDSSSSEDKSKKHHKGHHKGHHHHKGKHEKKSHSSSDSDSDASHHRHHSRKRRDNHHHEERKHNEKKKSSKDNNKKGKPASSKNSGDVLEEQHDKSEDRGARKGKNKLFRNLLTDDVDVKQVIDQNIGVNVGQRQKCGANESSKKTGCKRDGRKRKHEKNNKKDHKS